MNFLLHPSYQDDCDAELTTVPQKQYKGTGAKYLRAELTVVTRTKKEMAKRNQNN